MKRSLSLLFAILALAIVASAQNLTFNKSYDTPLFSAVYANEMEVKLQTQEAKKDDNSLTVTQAMYMQSDDDLASITVGYFNLPTDFTISLDAGLTGSFVAQKVTETAPRIDTHIGRLVARGGQAYGNGMTVYTNVAFDNANHRTWFTMFLCVQDKPCSKAVADRFFNSVVIK